ncbi:MAG: NYN domain-containing protein [Pseudomonadales bacterium]
MKRIAVLVDVQNIYYTTRQQFSRQFNYHALWRELSAQGEIIHAYAYATDRGDSGQQKFQHALESMGFKVKLKPYIQRRDGSAKGDWDVGICVDAMLIAEQVDTLVLLSGDGDFAVLLEALKTHFETECIAYGVSALSAKALMDSASQFRPITHALLK